MNEGKPKISIIIPIYNAEKYLARCLDSIFDFQIFDNYEVIVVDNNSSDKTTKIIVSCDLDDITMTEEHIKEIVGPYALPIIGYTRKLFDQIEAKSKELNT